MPETCSQLRIRLLFTDRPTSLDHNNPSTMEATNAFFWMILGDEVPYSVQMHIGGSGIRGMRGFWGESNTDVRYLVAFSRAVTAREAQAFCYEAEWQPFQGIPEDLDDDKMNIGEFMMIDYD